MSHINVIVEDFGNHPHCPHGPTVLFSRSSANKCVEFFACSACRDRKDCPFYLCKSDFDKVGEVKHKKSDTVQYVNHKKLFVRLNKMMQLSPESRSYCKNCEILIDQRNKHDSHDLVINIDDYLLSHPSELLEPLDNAKKEAQFLFSKLAIKTVVDIVQSIGFRKVINIGTPRIHEYITEQCPDIESLLLDIDGRYHTFFGPLQFCWYNMFNHYFFLPDSKEVFKGFLQIHKDDSLVLLMDPPFGGRVELLAETVKTINKLYQAVNKLNKDISILWFFPYFMEPQILNSLPEFIMLDYKVDYDNHPLFNNGPKQRKHGSPVRIFTNVDPSVIVLPAEQGYKHCKCCNRWVAVENKHCQECNACTSKNGSTYIHCTICKRCVKSTWIHCKTCARCAQPDHTCGTIAFIQSCFHCKEVGHKKRQCPKVDHEALHQKRKKKIKTK